MSPTPPPMSMSRSVYQPESESESGRGTWAGLRSGADVDGVSFRETVLVRQGVSRPLGRAEMFETADTPSFSSLSIMSCILLS